MIGSRLIFRRQYLLSPQQIDCPFVHEILDVNQEYRLYSHSDLCVTKVKNGSRQLILLGDLFDYDDPLKGNEEILKDLLDLGLDLLLKRSGDYSGRFVILFVEKNRFVILNDATAARKVFFSHHGGKIWFASQQHLLAEVLGFQPTEDPSKQKFYQSRVFVELNNSNLGNTTYYDDILQLMPNHYFDIISRESVRFWPLEPPDQLTFEEVAEKCTLILAGHMKSIANRYKIMLPVTAGGDSRLLMSTTRDFQEDVYYYINQTEDMRDRHKDIRYPVRFFKKLGMEYHVLHLPSDIDPAFKEAYFRNSPLASRYFLPHIYNYFLHFADRVNLPGNVASSPWGIYHMNGRRVTVDELTRYYTVSEFEYAGDYYANWMNSIQQFCSDYRLNVISLFYWEERMANWGNQISIDKDIAQEEFNPLNSRILNELFLSLPLKYNNEPDKKLHKAIIQNLWPELMHMPFNPTVRTAMKMLLARLGLFTPISRGIYHLTSKTQ